MSAPTSSETMLDINPADYADGVYYLPAKLELQPRQPAWGHPAQHGLRDRVANDRPHGVGGRKLLCLLCMRAKATRGLPPQPVWMTFVDSPHGPVFRHEDGRSPHAEHTPESDIHKAFKAREADTWTQSGAEVTIEAWRPRAKRRPDVLAVGTRLTVAGEIQHTTVHPSVVGRRHKALTAAGDRVVWTTDRSSAEVAFLRRVPHLVVPALDDHRLYQRTQTRHLNVTSGWTLFESQRCGWADMWQGTTRCPVTGRLTPCGRLHLYPTLNPHAYRPDPNAEFPCGPSPDLDHLLEGILNDAWRPFGMGRQRTTWIPTMAYDHVVAERGGGTTEAGRQPQPPAGQRNASRVCEHNAASAATSTTAVTEPSPDSQTPTSICCGRRQHEWAGRPLQLGCQLCPSSPTYYRRVI